MDYFSSFFLSCCRRKGSPLLKALGRHLLTEFYGCDPAILNDVEKIRKGMEEAAIRSGAAIINTVFHRFAPHGVTGIVVIAESHLAIHTWPEYGYAAMDIFTCGEEVEPWKAYEFLKDFLKAEFTSNMELKRGALDILGPHATHKPHGVHAKNVVVEKSRDH